MTEEQNRRRLDLIDKSLSGFTPEENRRRFDLDPAWKAEFERRVRANLTEAEWAELESLQEQLFS